jgi:hypothetical protein
MFPLSIEGAIDVPIDGADAALNRLKIAAVAAGAKSVERQPGKLVFYGRLPWAMSWNPLFSFDYCEISSESGKIRYSCSTRYLFILVTVMVTGLWADNSVARAEDSRGTSRCCSCGCVDVALWRQLFLGPCEISQFPVEGRAQ